MKAFNYSSILKISLFLLLFKYIIASCDNCSKCYKNICYSCKEGYYTFKGSCKKCSSDCNDCSSSSSHCTSCNSGYYLESSSCHPCSNNCKTCSKKYFHYSCDSCNKGFYLSGNQCLKCDSNCKTCSGSATHCTSCEDGYYLSSDVCNKCSEPCENCKNSGKCSSCKPNYFLYYGKCYLCNTNCNITIKNDTCKCQECNEGYKLYNSQCIQNNSTNNEACDDGYYLTSDKICEECIESCKTCVGNASNCLSCEEGFILLPNNTCIENITDNEDIEPKDDFNDFSFDNISIMINSSEINFIIITDFILSEQNISIINASDHVKVVLDTNKITIYEQLKEGFSAIDLGKCEKIIKDHYNISEEEGLIIINKQSKNINNNSTIEDNSFNLGINNEIEIYDYLGRKLELSVCEEDIKILMNLENVKEIDIQTSEEYAKQGIDVFNAKDKFFNNLCHNYDNKDEIDIIIDDRRSDIYKNVSFCQDGCNYIGVDYDLKAANCECNTNINQNNEKNNSNNKGEEEVLNFDSIKKSFISNLLDFNIEVIYCYNLVFNSKILIKNIGFYCMSFLFVLQLIIFCIFLIKKLNPIKDFMIKCKESGKYLENNTIPKNSIQGENTINIKNIVHNNNLFIKNKKDKSKKHLKLKSKKENKYYNSKKPPEILNDRNNLINSISLENYENHEGNKNNKNKKKNKLNMQSVSENELLPKKIRFEDKENNEDIRHKKNIIKKRNKKRKKINNMETIGEDINEKKETIKKTDKLSQTEFNNEELDEMDFEEAIIYDKRSFLKLYFASLIDSQIILSTFFTSNNLYLFLIKLSFFISNFQMNFFLNALFYTDEYISDAYHNNGVLDFVSGLPKSIYSFVSTLIITNLLKMLSNNKSELMQLIKESLNDERYLKLINIKLKKLRNKLIIYYILIFLLGLIFFYYVSSFCAVYRYSQKYWLHGCLESFAMDGISPFIISIFISLLKYIAIKKKNKYFFILYNIVGVFL